MRVRVKVCGITSPEDGLLAAELGADAVGLIFAPESPRRVATGLAGEIARVLPPFVQKIGVFVNEPGERLASLARQVGLDGIQFHGEERPELCRQAPLPWYKAFCVGADFDVGILDRFAGVGHLLDACVEGSRGGTGATADWGAAAKAARRHRIILSGGLGPDNIVAAVAAVQPMAVDVNSGVERSAGVKDPDKLARVFRALQAAGYR